MRRSHGTGRWTRAKTNPRTEHAAGSPSCPRTGSSVEDIIVVFDWPYRTATLWLYVLDIRNAPIGMR